MNRMPVAGDVVVIGRREMIVVQNAVTEMSKTHVFHAIKRDDLGKINPKEFYFYVAVGMASVEDKYEPIGLNEIGFIEQVKLKCKTEVVYFTK